MTGIKIKNNKDVFWLQPNSWAFVHTTGKVYWYNFPIDEAKSFYVRSNY